MPDKDWEKERKTVKVYQAKAPNFGLGEHVKWNDENYKHVAEFKVIVPASHDMCLDMAFSATQNIDDSWAEKVKNLDWIAEGRHRSTSVGDVVTVNDMPYRCEMTGWSKIN